MTKRQTAQQRYSVTISVKEVGHEETVTVVATDEWQARTAAMFACTYPITGETVEYTVSSIR
jgi:hypothetical protein